MGISEWTNSRLIEGISAYWPAHCDGLSEGVIEGCDELTAWQDGHLGRDRTRTRFVLEPHRTNLTRCRTQEYDTSCLDRGRKLLRSHNQIGLRGQLEKASPNA